MMEHIRNCGSSRKVATHFDDFVDISKDDEEVNANERCIPKSEDNIEESEATKKQNFSALFSPSSVSSSATTTSSILGSLERMVESSFKGFKHNNSDTTSAVQTHKEEGAKDAMSNHHSKTMLQRLGLDDHFNDVNRSRMNQGSKDDPHAKDENHYPQQLIGRAQSPFSFTQNSNRLHDSDPILDSTSATPSNLSKNVLLRAYHQPLTALRKLVEINRNVSNAPNVGVNDDASSDVVLCSSSPSSISHENEDGEAIKDDHFPSYRKRQKVSSATDVCDNSSRDSASPNPTLVSSKTNVPERIPKVRILLIFTNKFLRYSKNSTNNLSINNA